MIGRLIGCLLVVCCSLFPDCCLLCVRLLRGVRRSLLVACCLLSVVVCCVLFAGYRALCVVFVCCVLFALGCLLCVVCSWLFRCVLFVRG